MHANNMDIKTLLYNLREEVSCPVCSDLFKDPRQLPCLHSFCRHCLEHWHQSSGGGNAFRCPKCQALSNVPASGDLKDLPTSFYLNGLIDVLAIKECESINVKCGNCETRSSAESSYCFQCCRFYCEQCLFAHNIMRDNKDHRVLALKEFQDKDYEDVLNRPAFCSRQGHQKKELEYFCKKCEEAVCQTCVTLDHGTHTLTLIKEEAETQKLEMAALIQSQRENLETKMRIVAQLDEDCAKLVQQEEKIKSDIEKYADDLIKTIQEKRQIIIAAVENEIQRSVENLTTKKSEIQQQMKAIESTLEKADQVLARSTSAELVRTKKSLESILAEIVEKEPIVRDPDSLQALAFTKNLKMLENINGEELGFLEGPNQTKASESVAEGKGLNEATFGRKAHFILTTRNAGRRQCYDKHDRITVDIRDEQGQECVREVLIDNNKDGVYYISYFPRVQGKCNLSINVNGKHVPGSPFLVLVKAFEVKPVLSFGDANNFPCSLGIAVSDRDEIAVTDLRQNKVQIFSGTGNFVRSFGRQGTGPGEFIRPIGIAINTIRKTFIADTGNSRIQIFNEAGEFIGMFGENQLSNPWGLSKDSDGNIIVADSGNRLIKLFSADGKLLRSIGGQEYFQFPIHCVQCDEYLIVCDKNGHCISVFDRDGKFQHKFGKQGAGEGEFNFPRYLSVTKSGHILVCDSNNHRIQIFEVNGKFVGKFGTIGVSIGELRNPCSVAVLSNDQIVVSDSGNHRIQIFQ